MSNSASLASSSCPPVIPMDPRLRQLFNACNKGDFGLCTHLIIADPDILLSTTPQQNNCLHISAMLGHHEFAKEVWSRAPSLISGTNVDGETPLIAAIMAANLSLPSDIITAASQYMQHDDLEEGRSLNRMLLKFDKYGANALHHALRNGFENLALQLLEIEPRLSEQVNEIGESPMQMAARRGYSNVVERLLQIPSSADCGPKDESAMHTAVKFSHTGIVKQMLKGRPQLAYRLDLELGGTPLYSAAGINNLEMVKIFLAYDPNLAYAKNEKTTGGTIFNVAAVHGNVSLAKVIIGICPDSAYIHNINGCNALHLAIQSEKLDFVEYILRTPQLHRLIHQTTKEGGSPLHSAAYMCEPKMISALLAHARHDYTATNSNFFNAVDIVFDQMASVRTLKWNESFSLLSNAIPFGMKDFITNTAKQTIKKGAIQEIKSLTTKYTSNTSLVAGLLATITFAAAFTLPGGFSSDPADAGLPIFARKTAFQVFLMSDTIAMCCSLSVAFLCILATWEDLDFLLNYRKTTRVLMWCAYGATALAFGTGLFTVIAPNNLWLGILILVLCTILPLLSKIIGDWPILMLRYRLHGLFQKDLLPNI